METEGKEVETYIGLAHQWYRHRTPISPPCSMWCWSNCQSRCPALPPCSPAMEGPLTRNGKWVALIHPICETSNPLHSLLPRSPEFPWFLSFLHFIQFFHCFCEPPYAFPTEFQYHVLLLATSEPWLITPSLTTVFK